MSTTSQDREFNSDMEGQIEIVIASSALENAMQWIGNNMNPDDVFSIKDLENWAESNGYTKE
jgi:hypothetical protein